MREEINTRIFEADWVGILQPKANHCKLKGLVDCYKDEYIQKNIRPNLDMQKN